LYMGCCNILSNMGYSGVQQICKFFVQHFYTTKAHGNS
jgi:hypothetical protein